ncbi:dihydroorotase [Solimonas marina]|uniref:Dihydroorotase n=1 Tax=Solimonas marina TaxID=2714601 RepID=A0A969WCI0_9GAMM|nr:dihydroorotase [Solimonas marina]NKF24692.1 dihydroorotase [Solimonas marina]
MNPSQRNKAVSSDWSPARAAAPTTPARSLLIRGARVLDPASGFDGIGHVGVRDGVIDSVSMAQPKGRYEQTIDAKGLWLMPGLVDLCARFREPGQTHKASFASEIPAAQAGGITTVILPPDSQPVIDSPAALLRVQRIAAQAGGLDARVLGALTKGLGGEALSELSALQAGGAVGASQALAPIRDVLVARRALDYARGLGITVHVFAQNAGLAAGGCAHEGAVATRLGLSSIPATAEVADLRFWISLVEDTGARVHFNRLSTARGAELIESAQQRGLPVTADVAAHQLFLTDVDVDGFNALCHVIPPLRDASDRDALRAAVASGVIGAICSDHQPHDADAKINPFPMTEPGISALETLLPLTLELVHDGVLDPLAAAARLSLGPARIAGLDAGTLSIGANADLVLIDPQRDWTLHADHLRSAGRHTPFDGRVMRGAAVTTLFRGVPVYTA